MIGQNVTAQQVQQAARQVNLRADIRHVFTVSRGAGKGPGVRFGLKLGDPVSATGKKKDNRREYQRVSTWRRRADGTPRRNAAVCWHGHRDFFRALFARAPEARVASAQTKATVPGGYYTAGNFEQVYQNTGDHNIGSMFAPMRYADACACDDDGGRGGDGVRFSTLTPDSKGGAVESNVRTIRHADLRACPFTILVPSHYRPDGTCKCNDPEEQARMIAEWDYTPEDFARKGVAHEGTR